MSRKIEKRFDAGQLRQVVRTPEGYLKAEAFATRAGVFTYIRSDGSVIRELRLPSEVFAPESMDSLKEKPITHEHPAEMLTAHNTKQYAVGFVGERVDQEDIYMKCNVTITDEQTIKAILEGGKQETSCGYQCELEPTSGVWENEPYDMIQRNIRYNHLAVVDRGRAGPEVRLRLDSESAMMKTKEGETMKIKIGNVEVEVSEAVGIELQKKLDSDAAQIKALEGEKDKLQGRVDSLETELKTKEDEFKVKLDAAPTREQVREELKARMALEEKAKKILDEEAQGKMDSMSDLELKKAMILAKDPEAKLDGRSEEYVEGRFEPIARELEKKEDSEDAEDDADALAAAVSEADKKAKETKVDAEDSRKKAMDEAAKAWQQPIGTTKASLRK